MSSDKITLKNIFGEKPKPKPKSIKLTKVQLLEHRAKHGATPEVKAQIIEAKEINKYGKEARAKRARKDDVRNLLIEKGTRPKGKFYDTSLVAGVSKAEYNNNPLAECFKIDGNTAEGQDEIRIHHFGGKLD